jgi:hypothetical protein
VLKAQQILNGPGWHRAAGALWHASLDLGGFDFAQGAEVGLWLLTHHPHGIVMARWWARAAQSV